MRRHKLHLILIVLCACVLMTLTGCNEQEMNTSKSTEGVITFYQTSNRDQLLTYLKNVDESKFEILDVSAPSTGSFSVTLREIGKWKTSENMKAYDIAVLDGYYMYTAKNKQEYLDFLEQFESEIYKLIDITVNTGNGQFCVIYVEAKN